ncbi:MAG TPA: insulinase family protein, partial [Actinomycetota bacterium]|nr:insulinase family protein [Actinomycetota bacterium]
SPDYLSLAVLSSVIGGSANSRLSNRVREEKGYTYGIGGGFDFRRFAGPFRVSTPVKTAITVDAIREIIDVLDDVRENGITAKELEEAKGFLAGLHILRFEGSASIAGMLASQIVHDLPEDYNDTFRDQVWALDLDEVNAATRYLRENRAIVLVGDAEEIRDDMVSADFGPVAIVEDPEPGQPPDA